MRHGKIIFNAIFSVFLLVSALSFLLATYCIFNVQEYAEVFGIALNMIDEELRKGYDLSDWRNRWIRANVFGLLFGAVGSISSIGILGRKNWARLLWLTLITISFLQGPILHFTGAARYEFERYTYIDFTIFLLLMTVSWVTLHTKNWEKYLQERASNQE